MVSYNIHFSDLSDIHMSQKASSDYEDVLNHRLFLDIYSISINHGNFVDLISSDFYLFTK